MLKIGHSMFRCQGSSTAGIIPPLYFLEVVSNFTGTFIWERPQANDTSASPLLFRFQTQLPPEKRATHPPPRTTIPLPQPNILDQDWSEAYCNSPEWGYAWDDTHEPNGTWPEGFRLHSGRLYLAEKLCVPEDHVQSVIRDFHLQKGHAGVERLVKMLPNTFAFPPFSPGTSLRSIVMAVKKACHSCQLCDAPTWASRGKFEFTPIPEHPFISVCVDIFSLPQVTWREANYDQVLVCVDRHTGWIIAIPTEKVGLTSEKCAHLLLDEGWNILGIPSVLTSDQGPQFSGQIFQNMCSRLGIRQAYSQAHRPQANGRAEVAGKQLITHLRKLHADDGINWVQALPRVLLQVHDQPGESGISPYQLLFAEEEIFLAYYLPQNANFWYIGPIPNPRKTHGCLSRI